MALETGSATAATKKLFVITGATGNVGNEAARRLLALGHGVRVLGRDSKKLQSLVEKGAEARTGSVTDPGFLAQAFEGADGVFLMIPPDYVAPNFRAYQGTVSDAYLEAVKRSGVTRAVVLSSFGAQHPEGTGPITGLHELEKKLESVPALNVVYLRAAYFMENLFSWIGLVKAQGIAGGAIRGEVPVPMIATRDIGAEVAALLDSSSFDGKVARELLGPRDYTHVEAARILGTAIGKPDLPYVTFPYEAAQQAMEGMGLSPSVASGMIELSRAINEGFLKPSEARSATNTTPTTLEEFATGFAGAFAQA